MKRRNHERKWPGLSLKSPGIRPKGLPGKHHPNPLPKIGSRPSKDDVSPLGSPSFGSPVAVFNKQSPVSTPVTPSYQTSPRESDSSLREADPIKMSVILPHNILPVSTVSLPTFPPGKPPPLPPKPRHTIGETPPLPPRDLSPPPPIPPRLAPARPHSGSHRSPLESRPPQMDPVFPQQSLPPSILPRLEPLSRPPTSLPHSASWLPSTTSLQPHNGLAPLSAGPEIGSHFTFGAHTVSPQLPPRPSRTTSTPR